MSEQTEIEAVAQAIWEGLERSRPGDIAAPSIRRAAEAAIAALDSLRGDQITPEEALVLLDAFGSTPDQIDAVRSKLRRLASLHPDES